MKVILIVVGGLSLVLGGVGVVFPVLPTTPFLLLTAFCFAKSSDRLSTWFKGTKLYKNNLESFAKKQGMTWKTKLHIMVAVTIFMGIGFIAMRNTTPGRICLAAVWVAHMIALCFVIKTCPTVGKKDQEEPTYDDQ